MNNLNKKIDLLDLQRKSMNEKELQEKYGISEKEAQRIREIQLLTFHQSKQKKDKIIAKTTTGGIVFPHRDGGERINPGETWFVELEQHDTYYFARPIEKIDARFFFDLRVDQIDDIADIIFSKHKSIIEPTLEERIKEEIQQDLEKEYTTRLTKENEQYEIKIQTLQEELSTLTTKHQRTLKALEKTKKQKKETKPPQQNTTNISTTPLSSFPQQPIDIKIRRIEPDVLESKNFTKPHYFVHVSSDQTLMIIRPHKQGNILCTDNKITLKGLGLITEYGGPEDLICRYNSRYGGYEVNLRYRPSSSHLEEK